ncbi:MAG: hypothetical protein AABW49_00640 [Nanoarchaeota archaeon]
MDELPEAVFTWKVREDGLTEVVQGHATIKDILYEIARQAYRASVMEAPIPGQSTDPPSDEFLAPYFAHLQFPTDGISIARTDRHETDELFGMDYVGGLPVKTSVVARDGKILFCSRLYDMNHRVDHLHVMRTANMALEIRLQ